MLTYYINLCSPNIRWRHRFFEIRTPLRGIATGQALTNLATVQGVGSNSRPFWVPTQQAVYQNRSRVSSQQTMMAAIMKMVRKDLLWEVWSMLSWLRWEAVVVRRKEIRRTELVTRRTQQAVAPMTTKRYAPARFRHFRWPYGHADE